MGLREELENELKYEESALRHCIEDTSNKKVHVAFRASAVREIPMLRKKIEEIQQQIQCLKDSPSLEKLIDVLFFKIENLTSRLDDARF